MGAGWLRSFMGSSHPDQEAHATHSTAWILSSGGEPHPPDQALSRADELGRAPRPRIAGSGTAGPPVAAGKRFNDFAKYPGGYQDAPLSFEPRGRWPRAPCR